MCTYARTPLTIEMPVYTHRGAPTEELVKGTTCHGILRWYVSGHCQPSPVWFKAHTVQLISVHCVDKRGIPMSLPEWPLEPMTESLQPITAWSSFHWCKFQPYVRHMNFPFVEHGALLYHRRHHKIVICSHLRSEVNEFARPCYPRPYWTRCTLVSPRAA